MFETQDDYPTQWAAIRSIADKIGCSGEALRNWVRQAEADAGQRPGLTSDERERLRELERENRELRRANDIPKHHPPVTVGDATLGELDGDGSGE